MTFESIVQELRKNDNIPPGTLSAYRMFLSAEYSYIGAQLTEILMKKPQEWMRLREGVESDKQADRKWDSSVDGRLEMSYRFRQKSIEKMVSAIKTRLEVLAFEARNQM